MSHLTFLKLVIEWERLSLDTRYNEKSSIICVRLFQGFLSLALRALLFFIIFIHYIVGLLYN